MTRVLSFYPWNPFPPHDGATRRCVQIVSGLTELGCKVTLVCAARDARPSARSAARRAAAQAVSDWKVYTVRGHDDRLAGYLAAASRALGLDPLRAAVPQASPALRAWFAMTLLATAPDVLLMTYAQCDVLVPHRLAPPVKAIDTIDLHTLNEKKQAALWPYLKASGTRPLAPDDVPDNILRETFFDEAELTADPGEFRIYDRYDHTIAIAPDEAELMRAHTSRTAVRYIPMAHDPVPVANAYDGPALLTMALNPFNIQGYLYFVKRVLPLVRRRCGDFCLHVTGGGTSAVREADGVVLRGLVPDLAPLYASARLAISPVIGGTGQQVKVFEAMAHGLPVVTLRRRGGAAAIRHGVNGFRAEDAAEFAEYVVRLWQDRALCRRMGEEARRTIACEFSREHLLRALSTLLERQRIEEGADRR